MKANETIQICIPTGEPVNYQIFGEPMYHGTTYQWFDFEISRDVKAKDYSSEFDHSSLCFAFIMNDTNRN